LQQVLEIQRDTPERNPNIIRGAGVTTQRNQVFTAGMRLARGQRRRDSAPRDDTTDPSFSSVPHIWEQ
jgi:hypothetical protein